MTECADSRESFTLAGQVFFSFLYFCPCFCSAAGCELDGGMVGGGKPTWSALGWESGRMG